ncbi:MAG: minor capsid protein [bacterium]|nr:minor capsid protein [bacterium]
MLLDDIAAYLQAQGIGTVGTDIHKGFLPDQPDNVVALFEYAGSAMGLTMCDSPTIERPGLQVRVRNRTYPAARAKIEAVVDVLHGCAELVLGGTRYLLIRANQSPASMGLDASNRSELVVNFTVLKER